MARLGFLAVAALIGAASASSSDLFADAAVWPQVCTNSSKYSAWNQTRCDAGSTCCPSGFSVSGLGCCPFAGATCCPGGYQCCPGGSVCVPLGGTGYSEVFTCAPKAPGGVNTTSIAVCKPGPPLPYSTTLKNVLIIGDR